MAKIKALAASPYTFVSLNDAAADKAIKSIRSRGVKLRNDMHSTAVGLIMHMMEHGRHTKFIALADAIGDTLGKNQRKAFIEWVLAFTHLTFNDETKTFDKDASKENKLEDAKETPFWEFEKEAPSKPVDIQKLIKDALARASKASENNNVTDMTDVSFIEHIAAAVASYKKPASNDAMSDGRELAEVIKGEGEKANA